MSGEDIIKSLIGSKQDSQTQNIKNITIFITASCSVLGALYDAF